MNQSKLLEGLKIIDFTRLLPGPVSTHLLAQMGAEVIKIESPKRIDYTRFIGMPVDGASPLFHQLNHNKTLLSIDYNTPEGKQKILEIIKDADAVIEQFRPGAMDAWGLGYSDLKAVNPGLIYLAITGYDQDGDYSAEAGHDLNYLAYAGIMSLLKDEQGKPVVPGTQFSDIGGAYMAVIALQSALIQKGRTGKGVCINVPLSNAVNPFLAIPYALHSGNLPHEQFNVINGKTTANYAAYECADGKWISLGALEMKFWNNFCELAGRKEWKTKNQMELMVSQFDKTQVQTYFKTKTRDEWISFFKGKDVCIAPVLEIDELENSGFVKNSKTFEEFRTSGGETLKTIALPFSVIEDK